MVDTKLNLGLYSGCFYRYTIRMDVESVPYIFLSMLLTNFCVVVTPWKFKTPCIHFLNFFFKKNVFINKTSTHLLFAIEVPCEIPV